MKNIKINNFKGIRLLPNLSLCTQDSSGVETETNLLLYAENGVGKTSIAEAIRLFSYANAIENEVIEANKVGEERDAARRDWLSSFLHDTSNEYFEIKIDENTFSQHKNNSINYTNTFILSRYQLVPSPTINIRDIIGNNNFGGPYSYDELSSRETIQMVLEEVNYYLENVFKEQIRVILPESSDKIVGITGITGLDNDHITENINIKLNEANQNLVKVLIFICYLYLLPAPSDPRSKYFVVFDDVMSSLDLANRIILARIIINLGEEHQLLVMTHNAGFYNLIKHISGISQSSNKWIFATLYKTDGVHSVYTINDNDTVESLLKDFGGTISPTNTMAVNAMRKKFERLLHEFSKIIVMGIQDETSDIITRICNNSKGYYCHIEGDNIYTHFDLIKNISNLTEKCPSQLLQSRIRDTFKKYDNNNKTPWIAEAIWQLQTYQKVILHQGSHDQTGTIPIISTKEIAITLDLMQKLEKITKRSSSSFPYFI